VNYTNVTQATGSQFLFAGHFASDESLSLILPYQIPTFFFPSYSSNIPVPHWVIFSVLAFLVHHLVNSVYLTFLSAFEKLRESTINFVMSVCPSVRPYAWNNSALTGRIFRKSDIGVKGKGTP
jgi:hypothetical protein